ncbi:MAG: TrkH family potassium uptake protein [Planctomycetota bacterium]|jgi:trk system potassium uptake protein TrkH
MARPRWQRPEFLLPVTFLGAIVIGTVLLSLPGVGSERVGLLEAFFTATSAVCVTGLVVVDTGTDFTAAGQIIIAVLIQLGGLGMMTFSILALVLAGRRVSLDHEAAVKETFTLVSRWRLGRLLAGIIGVTLLFEIIGCVVLQASFDNWGAAAFHSISAFCNAGFSLLDTSLQGLGLGVVIPVMALFVFGGLGYTTLLELGRNLWPRRRGGRRFSMHARIVLISSLVLWLGGALLLVLAERGRIGHALFMSATARTAGFDTTPVGDMHGASLMILMPLMLIGASPGSTGGGIKTTTLALAVLAARATLKGRANVVFQGREIPHDLVRRMFAVIGCSILVIFLTVVLLYVFEGETRGRVLALEFEAVSAFGTVGLSTGITPHLSMASKILLCIVMFVGRVGSLSIFILLVRDAPQSRVRYPEERILIG